MRHVCSADVQQLGILMCKADFSSGLEMVWGNNFGTGIGYQIKFEYAQVRSDTGPHRMLSKNDLQL